MATFSARLALSRSFCCTRPPGTHTASAPRRGRGYEARRRAGGGRGEGEGPGTGPWKACRVPYLSSHTAGGGGGTWRSRAATWSSNRSARSRSCPPQPTPASAPPRSPVAPLAAARSFSPPIAVARPLPQAARPSRGVASAACLPASLPCRPLGGSGLAAARMGGGAGGRGPSLRGGSGGPC